MAFNPLVSLMSSLTIPFTVDAVTRRTPSLYPLFTGFGVSSFGYASVTVSSPVPTGLVLTLLSERQHGLGGVLADNPRDVVTLCSMPAALRLGEGRSFAETSLYHGQYGLYVLNCLGRREIGSPRVELRGFEGVVTISSEGNALPSQDRPLVVVYGLQLVALFALVAWCAWMARRRSKIHWFVLAAAVLRLLETLVKIVVLSVVSGSGGREPQPATVAVALLDSLAASSLFVVFFLAGFGWKISPRPLHPRSVRLIAFSVTVYLASLLAWAPICSTSVTSVRIRKHLVYCSSTAFIQVIIRLGLTFSVLGTLNPTILYVRAWASEREMDPSSWTATAKFIRSANVLRGTFLTFVFFPALLLFMDAILVQWEQVWVLSALAAIVTTAILIVLARL